ncbi:MAG: hypothetical protein NTX22_00485 [Ignavibacteriales bacterium]|nr:hypothetical protein [Ignavibacteriales bacterium]
MLKEAEQKFKNFIRNNPKLNKVISEVADENGFQFADYSLNLFVKYKDVKKCKRSNPK